MSTSERRDAVLESFRQAMADTSVGIYCHRCQRPWSEIPSGGVCPSCGEGFIEELSSWARVRRLALLTSLIALTDRNRPVPAQAEALGTLQSVDFSSDLLKDLQQACCCVICQEDFVVGGALAQLPRCGHLFHDSCVREWFSRANTCPICRSSLDGSTQEGHEPIRDSERARQRVNVELAAVALQSRVGALGQTRHRVEMASSNLQSLSESVGQNSGTLGEPWTRREARLRIARILIPDSAEILPPAARVNGDAESNAIDNPLVDTSGPTFYARANTAVGQLQQRLADLRTSLAENRADARFIGQLCATLNTSRGGGRSPPSVAEAQDQNTSLGPSNLHAAREVRDSPGASLIRSITEARDSHSVALLRPLSDGTALSQRVAVLRSISSQMRDRVNVAPRETPTSDVEPQANRPLSGAPAANSGCSSTRTEQAAPDAGRRSRSRSPRRPND